jgi:uncharacterized protein (TIGR00369 family)
MPDPRLAAIAPVHRPAALQQFGSSGLSGVLGVVVTHYEPGVLQATMPLRDELLLTAGSLVHAGTVMAFADTCAGWGCLLGLPEAAAGFTTVEGKVNLIATATRDDVLRGEARMLHQGRQTEVWDVTVVRDRDERTIAIYRCTQMLLANSRLLAG